MAEVKYGFTADQIMRDGRVTENDINRLKLWLREQNDVPKLTNEQIVLFLLSCCNDLDQTKTTIKAFYTIRRDAHELFNCRSVDDANLKSQLEVVEYAIFPERTDDGYAVIVHRLYDTYYSNYNMGVAMKLLFMTLDAVVYDYPPTGLVILFDMKGVGLMHLTKVRLGLVRAFFQYLQEGLPTKLKSIHVFNTVYFLDKVMGIIKPFIKKEVMDLLHFHPPNLDMESFYEKYLPRRCLSEDFGGSLPSVRVLHQRTVEKLADLGNQFEAEEAQRKNVD